METVVVIVKAKVNEVTKEVARIDVPQYMSLDELIGAEEEATILSLFNTQNKTSMANEARRAAAPPSGKVTKAALATLLKDCTQETFPVVLAYQKAMAEEPPNEALAAKIIATMDENAVLTEPVVEEEASDEDEEATG